MGDFVTPEQVASWPMMADVDLSSVTLLIGYVESEVLELVKVAAVDCPLWVSGVVAEAVGRAYSNPMRNESESVGPFARRMRDSGGSMLTKDERARLGAVGGFGPGKAFSIDTTPVWPYV